MKCDEVQPLHGPYLDSELDAKTSLEIQQHLAACPACARLLTEEEKLEAQIVAGLNRGPRTAALWEQIEREVAAARREPNLFEGCEQSSRSAGARTFLSATRQAENWRTRMSAPLRRSALYASGRRVGLRRSAERRYGLGDRLRAGWQASRWAWAGLAAVWVVILALNFAGREPDAPLVVGQEVPSTSEMRFALNQKHLLMAELALTSEPAPAEKPKPAPPSPRSDRRNETLNA